MPKSIDDWSVPAGSDNPRTAEREPDPDDGQQPEDDGPTGPVGHPVAEALADGDTRDGRNRGCGRRGDEAGVGIEAERGRRPDAERIDPEAIYEPARLCELLTDP